ncbi:MULTISPECIES: hypothetical protein [unclassified Mesorhizobium]|uniref:hypothetical protein n=1 Tax=unclassified Mesorhizobium TaxID=325217 RepID=UPI003339935B
MADTGAVLEEVAEWENCPLDINYPQVLFYAIRVKITRVPNRYINMVGPQRAQKSRSSRRMTSLTAL